MTVSVEEIHCMGSILEIRPKNSDCEMTLIESMLITHLGRHPVRRANEGLPLAERGRDLRRDAKVGQLHLALEKTQNTSLNYGATTIPGNRSLAPS